MHEEEEHDDEDDDYKAPIKNNFTPQTAINLNPHKSTDPRISWHQDMQAYVMKDTTTTAQFIWDELKCAWFPMVQTELEHYLPRVVSR